MGSTDSAGPLIAVVGCDGSGKSTLAAALRDWLAAQRAVGTAYLGLGSGNIGNAIKRWPLIGPSLEGFLAKKGGQARKKGEKIPGLSTALVIYGFSLLRRRRFNAMQRERARGTAIITDRYPQIEVPGFYDGPGLSAARPGNALVAALAARERAMYRTMAAQRPDLIIRLNVDAATALARKPDHKPDSIAAKVAVTPQLKFSGAPIVDLDATEPFETVMKKAQKAVLAVLADGPTVAAPRG